jgi:hypothetical protein
MKSSLDTFQRAFPILERLRELGFCLTEEEYDQKEQESGDDEDDSGEEGEAGAGSGASESSDEAPSEADNSDASDSEGADGPSQGDGEPGEDGGPVEAPPAEQVQEASDEISPEPEGDGEDNSLGGEAEQHEDGGDDPDGGDSDGSEHGDEAEHGSGGGAQEGEEEGDEGSPRESGHSEEAAAGPAGPEQEADGSNEAVDELTDEDSDSSRKDSQEESDDSGSDSDEVLDTGADEGRGGIPLKELYGTAEQAEDLIQTITKHGDHVESAAGTERVEERSIVQSIYFEKESATVFDVKEHFDGDGCVKDAWSFRHAVSGRDKQRLGITVADEVGENVLGPALLHMRRVFADNARANVEPHLRSGRVNARVLAKRAPFKDPRMFQKKRMPGKRSYAVLIGIDISGSTIGVNIALAKLAAWAQAELCARLGIEFAVYAHSATPLGGMHQLDMFCIKDFDQPWDKKHQKSLLEIGSWSENLDGHSLEFYRKKIERHPATDKIILYYSDGKMPAANYVEELEILRREIRTCRQKYITLLGVGIRTDSPSKHGLDTVQIDSTAEIGKVVHHLESRILHNR